MGHKVEVLIVKGGGEGGGGKWRMQFESTRTSEYDRVTTWLAPQFHEVHHVSIS